jgi:hypothetical protein
VQSAVGLLTAAALPSTTLAAGVLRGRNNKLTSLDHLNFRSFVTLKTKEFRIPLEGKRPVVLGLIQVKSELPAKGENFTLRFTGSRAQPLDQGTYLFENADLGFFEMMIVPGQQTATRQAYTAVINRTV